MVWNVTWDKGFIVGGDGNRRLTPNFRLKEFQSESGSVRVHRELVSALQMLRERFGKSISVSKTDDDGLGAVLAGHSVTELLAAAEGVKSFIARNSRPRQNRSFAGSHGVGPLKLPSTIASNTSAWGKQRIENQKPCDERFPPACCFTA